MPEITLAALTNRSLLCLTGVDVRSFLQNLVTNDLDSVSSEQTAYSALLTPQGKFLHDFIILEWNGVIYLDCLTVRSADLIRRLTMYKLRADVSIEDVTNRFTLYAIYGPDLPDFAAQPPSAGGVLEQIDNFIYCDPRMVKLGHRAVVKDSSKFASITSEFQQADLASYIRHRLSLGVPEGGLDLVPEKNFLLETNFEELNGVSFSKGCYVGQELTARTKHRAKIKKRLFQFKYEGSLSAGDSISAGGKEIAVINSFEAPYGLALTRLSEWQETAKKDLPLSPPGLTLTKPDYVNLTIEET